jgi:transposase
MLLAKGIGPVARSPTFLRRDFILECQSPRPRFGTGDGRCAIETLSCGNGSDEESGIRLQKFDYALVRSLERDPPPAERLKRLRTLPGVGPITALTWALEIGMFHGSNQSSRPSVIAGSAATKGARPGRWCACPLQTTKQTHSASPGGSREAGAPRPCHELAVVHETERQQGNANHPTMAIVWKMVAYLLAVERRKEDFVPAEKFAGTSAAHGQNTACRRNE